MRAGDNFRIMLAATAMLAAAGCRTREPPPEPPTLDSYEGDYRDYSYSADMLEEDLLLPAPPGDDVSLDGNMSADMGDPGDDRPPIPVQPVSAQRRPLATSAAPPRAGAAAPTGERCALAGQSLAKWQCDSLKAQVEEAQLRTIELTPDLPMVRTKPALVKLRLRQRRAGDPALDSEEPAGAGGRSVAAIEATGWLRAELSGAGFEIRPRTERDLPTGAKKEAQWIWEVVPKAGGPHKLTATVTPLLKVDDVEVTYGLLSKEVEIDVGVRTEDAVSDAAVTTDRLARRLAGALGALALLAAAAWGLLRAVRGKPAGGKG